MLRVLDRSWEQLLFKANEFVGRIVWGARTASSSMKADELGAEGDR